MTLGSRGVVELRLSACEGRRMGRRLSTALHQVSKTIVRQWCSSLAMSSPETNVSGRA